MNQFLTTGEFEEWVTRRIHYNKYMKSYSPYDNVTAQAYPHLLVTTGFDSQVQYWERQMVAKVRELKTDDHLLSPTWTQAMAVNLIALNRTKCSDGICFSGRAENITLRLRTKYFQIMTVLNAAPGSLSVIK